MSLWGPDLYFGHGVCIVRTGTQCTERLLSTDVLQCTETLQCTGILQCTETLLKFRVLLLNSWFILFSGIRKKRIFRNLEDMNFIKINIY